MKFFSCISHLAVLSSAAGVSALNVQLEEIALAQPPIPMMEFLSVSVERWGSEDVTHPSDHPFSMIKPSEKIEEVLGAHALQPETVRLTSFFYAKGLSKLRFVACSLLCALLLMAVFLAPWKCWSGSSEHDLADMAEENQPDLATVVKVGNGAWTQAYWKADWEQKQAFDLLFCTRIIPVHEFAHGHASEEHIEECVWIATQMLQQKSLEEWVQWRQQALKSFEDSIAVVSAAKTAKGYGKEEQLPWGVRARADDTETPPLTPPLQGVLKDLLMLKGAFPSPVMSTRSNASTVQASPVTPGRFLAQQQWARQPESQAPSLPFDCQGMNITFDKSALHEGPQWDLSDPFKTVPHVSPASLPPSTRGTLQCVSASSIEGRRSFRPAAALQFN